MCSRLTQCFQPKSLQLKSLQLGKPDYGYVTATEMLYSFSRMACAIYIPLVADLDTGYGNALNLSQDLEQQFLD